jgi:hypothetical protein
MDWNCTITLAFFKIRLDQIEAAHVFSDLADLEYLEELKRDYRATWKSLVEKGVLDGEPCEIMEGQCKAFLQFLHHVRGTITIFKQTIEEEDSRLNKGHRQGLTQALEFTQQHNTSLERKLAQDLADLENILDQNPWQHTSIIHALLDFDEELADHREAENGKQSLSSMDTNAIEKLMNFAIEEGEWYQELQDLMRSRVEDIEALLTRHERESTFLAQGLDCAVRGYFGTAYSCYSSISGDFGDIDYIPLELKLKDYRRGLEDIQWLQSECNETLSGVEGMKYWPLPFSFLTKKKGLEQRTSEIQENLKQCKSLMDPSGFEDYDHFEGKPGLEALELSIEDTQRALRQKTTHLKKKLTLHLSIGFVAFLLIASGIIWKWDSKRMGKLQESFPGRERFENDEDYASRMQEKYPGIRAGEKVPTYKFSIRK